MSSDTPGPGHNNPPEPTPATYAPPSDLEKRLREVHSAAFNEVEKWLASAGRAPEKVVDDAALANFGVLAGKLITFRGALDKVREAEKLPYLTACRVVDTLFNGMIGRCKDTQKTIEERQRAYVVAKEAAARALADKLAKEEAEKRDTALRAAERAQDTGDMDKADELFREAVTADKASTKAEAKAEAAPAALVRTRSTAGGLTTAKVEWAYEIEDLAKLDLNLLRPYLSVETIDRAVKAAVKGGLRQLVGVRIYEDRKVQNKGI